MWPNILSVISVIIIITYIVLKIIERNRLPPGPWAFPVIGNYRGINGSIIYKRMVDMYMPVYGKLVTLFWGNTPIVFINDYKLAVEALGNNGKIFGGRKSVQTEVIVSEERHNIFGNNYGPLWKEMVRALKMGVNKCGLTESFNQNTNKAVTQFCDELISNPNNSNEGVFPFDESYWLSDNVVLSILIGKIFKLQDKEYQILQDSRRQVFNIMDESEYVNWIPFGRYLPFKSVRKLSEQSKKLNDLLASFVNATRSMGKYRKTPDNIIEYLLHDTENSKKSAEKEIVLNDIHIRQIFKDILFASYEGVGLTNMWYMALLAKHPEIQERLRFELKSFCKSKNDFVPKTEWKSMLPYVQAVEFEFFRFSSIVGILDFHCAMKASKLGDYYIPKGSLIAVNQYAINHDANRWEDPESIKPERFLDRDGNFVERLDLIPFGLGVRMCPGTLITKGYGFLLLCNICLNYKVEWSPANEYSELVDDTDSALLFRYLKPYLVKISKL